MEGTLRFCLCANQSTGQCPRRILTLRDVRYSLRVIAQAVIHICRPVHRVRSHRKATKRSVLPVSLSLFLVEAGRETLIGRERLSATMPRVAPGYVMTSFPVDKSHLLITAYWFDESSFCLSLT